MSNGGMDPRLNCAARICCEPPAGFNATVEILMEVGCTDKSQAITMARNMELKGITFMPLKLAEVIAEMVQHPGRILKD